MKRVPLPPPLDARSFSVRGAADLDVPRKRLRAADLEAPFRGIRSLKRADPVVERCRDYVPRMRDDEFFSHSTAALLYGVALPRWLQDRRGLDVTGILSGPRTSGVVRYRSSTTARSQRFGLPLTHPLALLPELSRTLSGDDLVIAADAMVRRKGALTTLAALRAAAAASNPRGIRAVREALVSARAGTDSPRETLVRLILIRGGLPEPTIHHTIYAWNGDFIGTPDLSYPAEKVAIEYEGDHHWSDRRVFADDIERRELMQEAGWYVVRVISAHVRQPAWLVDRVARVLKQRSI